MLDDYDMGDYYDYEALERDDYYNSLEKEEDEFYENLCDELQNRIDKAIEYIENNEFNLDYKTGACIKGVMPLLDILRGEDNE